MQDPNSFKQVFLKNMITGLQAARASSKSMTLQERKDAVKLSADAAMAITRGAGTNWARALVTSLSRTMQCQALKKSIPEAECKGLSNSHCQHYRIQNRKVLRSCSRCSTRRRRKALHAPPILASSVVARRVVKKRTQILRRLIPGGESLDSFSLLNEALDYVKCLQAQVDLLRCLSKATEISTLRASSKCALKEREASNVGI